MKTPWTVLAILSALLLPAFAAKPSQPSALHVVGNHLKNAQGKTVRLQGVNIPSLECSNEGDHLLPSVQAALGEWRANVIRLPLAQDRWFGKMEGQKDGGAAYRKLVDTVIQTASARQSYVLLDLHWSDGGEWGRHLSQHKMPDANSILFWKHAAARYANNPAVLFDLYNEPRDVFWTVWRNGGEVRESLDKNAPETAYQTPGMQGLLQTIRATGAKNIVVAGGLDWAYDLSGIAQGFALSDSMGNGVMYGTHIYPWKGSAHENWDPHVSIIADKYPIFVGEVGCEPDPKQEDPMSGRLKSWPTSTRTASTGPAGASTPARRPACWPIGTTRPPPTGAFTLKAP
ncbi:MAG: glycoside hydrolase family 5 protein [Armatimonadota bacterium]|nr:glycoside hydrolase family 5 protein [Armatimonadota bacterium]